jgi:hypothetical protein
VTVAGLRRSAHLETVLIGVRVSATDILMARPPYTLSRRRAMNIFGALPTWAIGLLALLAMAILVEINISGRQRARALLAALRKSRRRPTSRPPRWITDPSARLILVKKIMAARAQPESVPLPALQSPV